MGQIPSNKDLLGLQEEKKRFWLTHYILLRFIEDFRPTCEVCQYQLTIRIVICECHEQRQVCRFL